MFCSNCGAQASGNFCSRCGAALGGGTAPVDASPQDWSQEISYEKLIRIPEVRDRIARHAAMSKKGLSGEEFLGFFDKIVPLGFSLEKLEQVVQPISAQLGLKTGKQQSELLPMPPGTALVAVLCSLARHGFALQQASQFDDGCVLEATVPSDLWSFEGTLHIGLRKQGTQTCVKASTQIKGQLFDWGKGERCLQTLFADLKETPA